MVQSAMSLVAGGNIKGDKLTKTPQQQHDSLGIQQQDGKDSSVKFDDNLMHELLSKWTALNPFDEERSPQVLRKIRILSKLRKLIEDNGLDSSIDKPTMGLLMVGPDEIDRGEFGEMGK